MARFVVLLRAVNVGKRQVRMAALREWLADDGFTEVETHIQTGNVRVAATGATAAEVERRLEGLLADRCGFDVPCIVLTPRELTQAYADALALDLPTEPPFDVPERVRRYAVFFKEPLDAQVVEEMAAYDPPGERIRAVGRVAHVALVGSFHEAKVFTAFRKALAAGTNRDLKVVAALVEKWGEPPGGSGRAG